MSSATSKRDSNRYSTYSATPTLTPSVAPSHISDSSTNTTDPRHQDIKSWKTGFERLEDKRLSQQRYAISTEKTEALKKLALEAKLDRALNRRMTGQDAAFRPKGYSEKKAYAA